jgi:hypothetical protein
MASRPNQPSPKASSPSRSYEADADLQQMYALLMEARSRRDDWRYWHVGELAFGFFMIDCHLDVRKHVRVWHEKDKTVGYAMLGDDAYFDWQVLPEVEGKGIEAEALAWAESLLSELRAGDAERWKGGGVRSSFFWLSLPRNASRDCADGGRPQTDEGGNLLQRVLVDARSGVNL